MQAAADAMAEALDATPPVAPLVPLVANVTASPVSDAVTIRDLLVQQVTGRVRWRESVGALEDIGVDQFVELGGKVLSPMVKRSASGRSEEHTSELQSLMRISYAVFCLKKKNI